MTNKKTKIRANEKLSDIIDHIKLLEEMLEDDEYCEDILKELSDINSSLISVGKIIVRDHLEKCVKDNTSGEDNDKQYNELMNIIYKFN